MAPLSDSLTLWALLLPPAAGLLWAAYQAWRISQVKLEGPPEGDNKRLTDRLYVEVSPQQQQQQQQQQRECGSSSNMNAAAAT